MSKLDLIKKITSTIVAVGTGKITYAIIRNNVETENIVDQVTVAAGSFAIGGIVAKASEQYTNQMIDEVAEAINNIKDAVNN